jgi:hypothetical protein
LAGNEKGTLLLRRQTLVVNHTDSSSHRHDHFYYVSKSIEIVGDHWSREENLKDVGFDPEKGLDGSLPIRIVKSGTDFREFGLLHLTIDTDHQGKKYIKHMTGNERKRMTN